MKDYPVFPSHDAVECFNCGRSLNPNHDPKTVTESNYANGSGGFKANCRDCDLITFYDLSAALPAYRRRAIATAAVLAAIVFTGCATKPNRRILEAAAPTAAELSRTRSQRAVIHTLQHSCLTATLSAAQTRYVASLDEYHAQSYLFALASADAHAAHCAQQTVTACERLFPGECIAPGEKGAERP